MDNFYAFVDESRNGRYTLCLVRVPTSTLTELRKTMDSLRKKGQVRIHMKQESDARRREILDRLIALPGWNSVVIESARNSRVGAETRQKLFLLLAQHKIWPSIDQLIVEDSTDRDRDKRTLNWLAKNGSHAFRFSFKRPAEDSGLWAADAIAWAFAKGGVWRNRVIDRVEKISAP